MCAASRVGCSDVFLCVYCHLDRHLSSTSCVTVPVRISTRYPCQFSSESSTVVSLLGGQSVTAGCMESGAEEEGLIVMRGD